MRLIDARRLAVRNQLRIRFPLAGGMECVVDEHGISRVPALAGSPDFNLEQEFARAGQFTLEPVPDDGRRKDGPAARSITREQLQTMAQENAGTAGPAED